MGRSPCCSNKEGLNRGAWTAVEDQILRDYVKIHGEGKWRNLPKKAGLKRCGKSCRLRWLNYLRPDIKRGNITHDEEELIIRLHRLLGNRWSLIAGRLPGRTDNEIKNYWNTNIGKKVQAHVPSSTSSHKPSNQSKDTQNTMIERSVGQPPNSPNTESAVVRTKASRCTKVFITSEPQKTEQHDTEPVVGQYTTVQDFVDDKAVGLESLSPFISGEETPSNFMMDFGMDDHFLSDFLNADFLQPCDYNNGVKEDSNTSTSDRNQSPPNSNQTLLFSEEMLHDSDPVASFLDEMDWLRDQSKYN